MAEVAESEGLTLGMIEDAIQELGGRARRHGPGLEGEMSPEEIAKLPLYAVTIAPTGRIGLELHAETEEEAKSLALAAVREHYADSYQPWDWEVEAIQPAEGGAA